MFTAHLLPLLGVNDSSGGTREQLVGGTVEVQLVENFQATTARVSCARSGENPTKNA
jgi:hypothetical protein